MNLFHHYDYSADNADYYCGDENGGARVQNDWRKLYVGNEGPARIDSEDDDGVFYVYGKKIKANTDYRYQGVDNTGVLLNGNNY